MNIYLRWQMNTEWSSWDDVYSIKTYDLPNLESPNWFVIFQLIVWIIPRRKVFQLRFHTLDADGVTVIRLVIEMHISGEVPKKKPVGKWLGLCNRNPDTHVSGECRQPVPRTLSLVRVLTPSTLSTNAFRNVRFTKSESVVYLQVLAFMS